MGKYTFRCLAVLRVAQLETKNSQLVNRSTTKSVPVTVELMNVKNTYNKTVYFQFGGQICICHDITS